MESRFFKVTETVEPGVERIRMERIEDGMPPAPNMVFMNSISGEIFRTRSAPQDGWVMVYRGMNGKNMKMFEGDEIMLVGDVPTP